MSADTEMKPFLASKLDEISGIIYQPPFSRRESRIWEKVILVGTDTGSFESF